MPHISITRLRLRSIWTLPAFFAAANRANAQAASAPGFIEGALLAEGRLVFWTRTVWQSIDAMKAYRDSGAHRDAMPKLIAWCDEAHVAHWQGEATSDWPAIRERMIGEGRASRVKHPSKNHASKTFALLKPWGPEQKLAPR